MNSIVISGVVADMTTKKLKKFNVYKFSLDGFKCVYWKDDLKIKNGDYAMAKGYLKLHEWEGKKLISDINLQYVELCPSAPEKAPEKERLTTWEPSLKNDDAKWLEEIENE